MAEDTTAPTDEDDNPVPVEPSCEEYPNGWSLVTAGTWQVSIGPDGLLMLPRHLRPQDVSEFVAAIEAAAREGARKIEENARNTTPLGDLPPRRAMVTPAGQIPPGATPMTVSAVGTNARPPVGAIGRRGRPQQTNRAAMPGQPQRR
jgi:hypothetical protein